MEVTMNIFIEDKMDLLVVKISIITGNFPDRRFSILLLSILIHERCPVCTVSVPVDQPIYSMNNYLQK